MRKYSLEDLDAAVSAVKEGGMSIRGAERHFFVPFKTLRDHVQGNSLSSKRGPKTVLSKETEQELSSAVKEISTLGHGLSINDVCDLAADIASKGDSKGFKKEKPTFRWFQGFSKRNNLTLRQPVNISVNRMSMENLKVKEEFYESLKNLYDKLKPRGLHPSMIYNMDESGLCLVSKSGKVVATKGTKIVRMRTGGERGENITVVACANATGSHILPPTVIIRGKSINEDFMNNQIEGMWFAHAPKSFMDGELFALWFERFKSFLPPLRPAILLLDGHGSHISLSVIESARSNDIHIFCLPPHTTHLYQPLDRGFFGPLKSAFRSFGDNLKRKNKKKSLSRNDFNKVLKPAWQKAATPANIVSGFSAAGIWPFNKNAVCLPCEQQTVDENQNIEPEVVPLCSDSEENSSALAVNKDKSTGQGSSENVMVGPQADQENLPTPLTSSQELSSSSGHQNIRVNPLTEIQNHNLPSRSRDTAAQPNVSFAGTSKETVTLPVGNSSYVSPVLAAIRELLAPIEETPSAKSKRVTKSRLITSDEFLKEIEGKEKEKEEKERQKQENLKERAKKRAMKAADKENKKKRKVIKKKARPRPDTELEGKSEESSIDDPVQLPESRERENRNIDDEDNELCGTCRKSFQLDFNGEGWIKCVKCGVWYHEKCQGLDSYVPDFICDDCRPLSVLFTRMR